MSVWCPKCHYKTVLNHFHAGHCPQCRTVLAKGEALTEDPHRLEAGKSRKMQESKRFEFDQRHGSDTEDAEGSGMLKSRLIDPTFGIKGRI